MGEVADHLGFGQLGQRQVLADLSRRQQRFQRQHGDVALRQFDAQAARPADLEQKPLLGQGWVLH